MLPADRPKQNEIQNAEGPSNQQQKPPILTLDADCLDELFDYLTLADLCSMGRTCKHLHRAAGVYFRRNYPRTAVKFYFLNNISKQTTECGSYTNFASYAQHIRIQGIEIKVFRHAALITYRNLETIEFDNVRSFTDDHYACIMKMNILGKISSLLFYMCSPEFRDELLNRILPFCVNLKCLAMYRIWSGVNDVDTNRGWQHQHIPSLERLDVIRSLYTNDLVGFLQANPQIKKLFTDVINSIYLLEAIQVIGMELDELKFHVMSRGNGIEVETRNRLIALNERGHIKNLTLNYASGSIGQSFIDSVMNISCLTSLRTYGFHPGILDVSALVNLKQFHRGRSRGRSRGRYVMLAEEANLWSKSLINLEELRLGDYSLLDAMPFARRLPKLKIIVAGEESRSVIDLKALNNDRKNLPNAQKLNIYLHDKAYSQLRWTSIDLFYDMVAVRKVILTKDIGFEQKMQD